MAAFALVDWSELAVLAAAAIGAAGASGAAIVVARRSSRDSLKAARRDAYRTVLRVCHDLLRWAHATNPMISHAGHENPDLPPARERVDSQALIGLYGSKEVRTTFGRFGDAFADFVRESNVITEVRQLRDADETVPDWLAQMEPDAWRNLRTHRTEMADALEALEDAMRSDTSA